MKKRSDLSPSIDWNEAHAQIIGLGEKSVRKNYYPQLRARLKELERFRALIDHAQDIMLLLNAVDWEILDANNAAKKVLGEGIKGSYLSQVLPKRAIKHLQDAGQKTVSFETWIALSGGDTIPIEFTIQTVDLKDGSYSIILGRNIQVRKRYEEKLLKQANYDDLTQLPNRALFLDRLTQSMLRAKRRNHQLALLFIDLDRFKQVNDIHGHAVGDILLCQVAERLSCAVRTEDSLARLGGDEFTIILSDINSPTDAEMVAEKISSMMTKPFHLEEQEVFVTTSVGIAIFPDDAITDSQMMRHADAAMYRAKGEGRNRFSFFTAEMNHMAQERAELESGLHTALEQGQLHLVYQPLVSLKDQTLNGAEVLLRWTHPKLGMIPPEKFIPIAEETGLILEIGDWVLKEALFQASQWCKRFGKFRIAVNVSSYQFKQPEFITTLKKLLHNSCNSIKGLNLELEITESLLIEDDSNVGEILQEISDLGVELSIDDFGTGYSSLGYLKRFPINTLKIDRMFIRDLTHDKEDAALTSTIISMAKGLGLRVIAEGVEEKEQFKFLSTKRCDIIQGYYFSPPLPSKAFEHFFENSNPFEEMFDALND